LIPNPILKVLSTFSTTRLRYLLMGGQACVLYGAAEFSRVWFRECRTAAILLELAAQYADQLAMAAGQRPLLALAGSGDETTLATEIELEEKRHREADRAYWAPLRAELEELRRR